MLSPDRVMRVTIEALFVALGALVVWLGATRHIFFDRSSLGWLGVAVLLILWGARGLWKPTRLLTRAENWTRGLSLVTIGLLMAAISRVPVAWVAPALAGTGAVLAMRGLIGAVLILRAS
jgi:hypothetical protein